MFRNSIASKILVRWYRVTHTYTHRSKISRQPLASLVTEQCVSVCMYVFLVVHFLLFLLQTLNYSIDTKYHYHHGVYVTEKHKLNSFPPDQTKLT